AARPTRRTPYPRSFSGCGTAVFASCRSRSCSRFRAHLPRRRRGGRRVRGKCMRSRRADARLARRQAGWIVGIEPWRSPGYAEKPLGAWLARRARAGCVSVIGKRRDVDGIVVVQPEVLLGDFIALLAVRPQSAGRGIGRALVDEVARRTFEQRRWLYVSS